MLGVTSLLDEFSLCPARIGGVPLPLSVSQGRVAALRNGFTWLTQGLCHVVTQEWLCDSSGILHPQGPHGGLEAVVTVSAGWRWDTPVTFQAWLVTSPLLGALSK